MQRSYLDRYCEQNILEPELGKLHAKVLYLCLYKLMFQIYLILYEYMILINHMFRAHVSIHLTQAPKRARWTICFLLITSGLVRKLTRIVRL